MGNFPPPPFTDKLVDASGRMSKTWARWFQKIMGLSEGDNVFVMGGSPGNIVSVGADGSLADSGKPHAQIPSKTADEIISGAWRIPKIPSASYSGTDGTLTVSDLGKTVKFTPGGKNVDCYLPSVGASEIDSWITIVRVGTGRLSVHAADNDTIEKSTPGGMVICDEAGRQGANITLFLATATQWVIVDGFGIWHLA